MMNGLGVNSDFHLEWHNIWVTKLDIHARSACITRYVDFYRDLHNYKVFKPFNPAIILCRQDNPSLSNAICIHCQVALMREIPRKSSRNMKYDLIKQMHFTEMRTGSNGNLQKCSMK